MRRIKVSPSDLAWLSDQCPACWHRKIYGIQQFKPPFPGIFNEIDRGMKALGVDVLRELGVPAIRAVPKEFVMSKPYVFLLDPETDTAQMESPGSERGSRQGIEIVIAGYLDKLVEVGEGEYGLIEMKTGAPSERNAARYPRQLHGYEAALRNPDRGDPKQITGMWIIYFTPAAGSAFRTKGFRASLMGSLTTVEVDIDRRKFEEEYLASLAEVASLDSTPPSGEYCEFCKCLNEALTFAKKKEAS